MADNDLTILISDIRALSALLNAANCDWWPSASQKKSPDMQYFSHISTLLGFGTDIPIAITGTITADRVIATIICSKKPEHLQQPNEELIKSHSVAPSTRTLGDIVKHTPQGLEGYVADLIDLFRMVQSGDIPGATIIQWVIYRGWFKLHSQLERSKTDFEKDLFVLMEDWSPKCDDPISEQVLNMPITPSIYEKYTDFTVDRTKGVKFLLNKVTAPMLVKTIARIFTDIRHTIADTKKDRLNTSYSLVNSFIWLHGVLANRSVQDLMTKTSLKSVINQKWPEEPGHKYNDFWDTLPGPNSMPYGLRYLRMLVACTTSVMRLNDREILPVVAATHATIVYLAPPFVAKSEHRSVLRMVIGEITKLGVPADAALSKVASEWIAGLTDMYEELESSCRLHAEAGLMAAVCDARLSHSDETASNKYGSAFLNIARMPIGTSGRCCPLCLRLTQILNTHFASPGNPADRVFSSIETHGKVLPWDPPQFGIPKAVLKQLRDELCNQLAKKAVEVGKRYTPEADIDQSPYYDLLAIQGKIPLPTGVEW